MATTTRKVNIRLIAYKGELDGVEGQYYGQVGEEVEVSDSYLDRFDRLNEEYGQSGTIEEAVPEAFAGAVENDNTAGPDPLDHGLGGDEGDEEVLEEPSPRASVEEWRAYAEQEGVEDYDTKTKKQLISELTGE